MLGIVVLSSGWRGRLEQWVVAKPGGTGRNDVVNRLEGGLDFREPGEQPDRSRETSENNGRSDDNYPITP
jgi:hypothetical protein